MQYRADIDGVRAIAILLVTIFHFDLFSIGKAGFIGVDVFFVISGFLITTLIVRDLESGTFHLGQFLYRRVRRLYPAMLVVLIAFMAIGAVLLMPSDYFELAREVLLSQFYVINFYFWKNVSYFGLQADEIPLLHIWSLAVEEQFYLLFPLFCALIWAWKPRWLLGAVVGATLTSFGLGLLASPIMPGASFYLLPTRAWELLAGGCLALALKSTPSVPKRAMAHGAGVAGLIFIAGGLIVYTPATPIPGWFALFPVGGTLLLLWGGRHPEAWTTRLLSWGPFVWIGLISYPLYLVHWPIIYLLNDLVFEVTLSWRVAGFIFSFICAAAIYLGVERPIRQRRVLPAPKAFLGGLAIATGAVVISAGAVFNFKGMPTRFPPEVGNMLAYLNDQPLMYRRCENAPLGESGASCRLGDPDAPEEIVVYGDSHANAFAHAIDLWLKREGRAARFTFSGGCPPVGNLGEPLCKAQFDNVLSYVKGHESVKAVLVVAAWHQPYVRRGLMHGDVWVPRRALHPVFTQELEASVAGFVAAGKQVVLVEPFYSATRNVPQAAAKNLAFDLNWTLDRTRAAHDAKFAQLFEAMAQAEQAGAIRVSLIDDYCSDTVCPALHDGLPMFHDNSHVADHMSDELSRSFERTVGPIIRALP